MPGATRRSNLHSRRRRTDDDGEDDGSTAGDLDDFSLSEGSVISHMEDDADAEGSDVSADEDNALVLASSTKVQSTPSQKTDTHVNPRKTNGTVQQASFQSVPGTDALMNGNQHIEHGQVEELQFDQTQESPPLDTPAAASDDRPETQAQKSRREHLEYIERRNNNPAFVPTRGGFFLHDDRSSAANAPFARSHQRGRGRGQSNFGRTHGPQQPEVAHRQWSHDLHDIVNKANLAAPPGRTLPTSSQIPTAMPAATPPNRTFSVTTILGSVVVQVSLPGVDFKKTFSNVVKRQRTLLPQHRPPLRRDKPVRISIPNEQARYIFPSIERSFIFIPRALRPNQQSFSRGRGRGSFHGSRRPSLLGGSVYTPSVAMSRKSSIGALPPSGLPPPVDPIRGAVYGQPPRPVVRMPAMPASMPMVLPMPMPMSMLQPVQGLSMTPHGIASSVAPMPNHPLAEQGTFGAPVLHSTLANIPVHQPRPQKSVSVSGIEQRHFTPPHQQQEQPFHHQMPVSISLDDTQPQASPIGAAPSTPLSHIPEGAVYAQPFQPYPVYAQPGYYGMPYSAATMYYPQTGDSLGYGVGANGSIMPAALGSNTPSASYVPANRLDSGLSQQVPVAHETNGMVYYYEPHSNYSMGGPMGQYPTAGMMGSAQYFYPTMPQNMYFAPPTGQ